MNPDSITALTNLPYEIQTYLACGFLGYSIGYIGLRNNHRTIDAVMLVFVFGAISSVIFNLAKLYFSVPATIALSLAAAVFIGAMWRSFGRRLIYAGFNKAKVHQDDGHNTAWQTLQDELTHKGVTQLSVHLADGRVLYCSDAGKYMNAATNGMNIGHDGSVLMVVDEEEIDGKIEVREGVSDDNWGTRLTYIPQEEIKRLNIRIR